MKYTLLYFRLLFITTALAICFQSTAQTTDYSIKLSTGNVTPQESKRCDLKLKKKDSFENNHFRVIQFFEIPSDQERTKWRSQGLILTDYLPNFCYYAVINESFDLKDIRQKIRSVFIPGAELKLEANLYSYYNDSASSSEQVALIVSYYETVSISSVIKILKQKGAEIGEHRDYSRQLDITISSTKLNQLIDMPFIQFIGMQLGEPIEEADNYSYRNTTGTTNYLNTGYNGIMYNGSGVTIAIGEGGTVDNTIDAHGRLIELETGSVSGHKVGCTENAGGAGNIDPTNKNNAWGSTIVSMSGQSYSSQITTNNVRYFNHSYGWSISGGYDSGARDHDMRTVTYPKHIVSYSSGNSGTDMGFAPYDTLAGWATITGQTKQNKNHLAVRNLGSDNEILTWGSSGPAYDGRIVPQITISGPEGTSFASPKAVGVFAVLEEVYKSHNSGQESTATLMKGIVLNTTDDMDDPGPDFKTGYGRPNSRRAYEVITNDQFLTGTISNGASNNHVINVPANVKQVRALLIWPDAAAVVNANPAIVNNLNFSAVDPGSTSYLPWVLNHTPVSALLDLPATRGIDNINTVEQITVDNPTAGAWTFTVNGALVPVGPQQYYVIYEFLYDELHMAYPLANEKLISGDEYFIRWENYGGQGEFTLDYRLNGGNWNNIANNLNSTDRQYTWNAPFVTGTQQIEFKIQRGSTISQSGINYIGKRAENFRIDKVCEDTVVLKWSGIPNASGYKIYRLGNQYMEEVISNITFNGTSAQLTGQSTTSNEYYALSAVTGSYEGQRTLTIVKAPGDFNCGGVNWIGVVSTDWFTTGNWGSGQLPTESDNVIIPSSAPFQPLIAATGAKCNNIEIYSGASLSFSNSTSYDLAVWGDWINDGTFTSGMGKVNFCDTIFYQEISGSSTSSFNKLRVAKLDQDNVLEAKSIIALTSSTNPLELVSGTFELSSNSTITPFTTGSGAGLSGSRGIWNNGGTINYGNYDWYLDAGLLKSTSGTTNVGTNNNNKIIYMNNGKLILEGGTMKFAGRIVPNSGISSGTFSIYDGELVLNTVGSTSTTEPIFNINPNATYNMFGGKITFQKASSNTIADFVNLSNNSSVTGGDIQIGNALTPITQQLRIKSSVPVYNLVINALNSPILKLVANNLTVLNDVTINGGTLNTAGYNMMVKGDWTNNGSFVADTAEVYLNGWPVQTINGTNPTSFSKLRLENQNGFTLNQNIQVNSKLHLTEGIVSTGSNTLALADNALVYTPSNISYIDGNCGKIGDDAFTFPIGQDGYYAPLGISNPNSVSDVFVASYQHQSPDPTYTTANLVAPVENVSQNEYWLLNRTNGNSDVSVTLHYDDDHSEEIHCLANMTIASWNGSQWINAGVNGNNGTTTSGDITSLSSTIFNAFTLANNDAIVPPSADTAQHFCTTGSTIADLTILGNAIEWYTAENGGNTLPGSTLLTNNTSYFATQTINGCESEERIEIAVTISDLDNSVTTINNILTANQSGVNYQWINCSNNSPISGENTQTFIPTNNGSYAVIIGDAFCSDTSDCSMISTLGIPESIIGGITVYPNPTDGSVNLVVEKYYLGNSYVIIDALGKQILNGAFNAQYETIALDNYADGIFFLKIQGKSETVKLIKQ